MKDVFVDVVKTIWHSVFVDKWRLLFTRGMSKRGSYAKGVAKREEILERALEVVAQHGYQGASVKEIAEAVSLSQAGLLHYFTSKEELFAEILRTRDTHDQAAFAEPESMVDPTAFRRSYLAVVQHNAQVLGLVHLFARMNVDAAAPEHPAHAYFRERGVGLRGMLSDIARTAWEGETGPAGMRPEQFAAIVQAVTDGLQAQWMLDPEIDMAGTIDALLAALIPGSAAPGDAD
ncbi:transcriptional regulator, TetR family [Agreia bicolorata]|uniref:Transcriptional regulator, TetR family n=2 Tax=Agreia bicolorata TaxID=110935 RepID=A0A1T4Y8Y9_9MICO|nr:transcriptional regulator, TetR family [Agreia bicolorata]